jgi:hypothetical protein
MMRIGLHSNRSIKAMGEKPQFQPLRQKLLPDEK